MKKKRNNQSEKRRNEEESIIIEINEEIRTLILKKTKLNVGWKKYLVFNCT